jgi:glycosyltransferase involved in cell wall biosynthesis
LQHATYTELRSISGRTSRIGPRSDTGARIALVHHWLVTMRGGEKVLEALAELFPSAELFTLVYDPTLLLPAVRRLKIHSSFLQDLPRCTRWYRHYLPLFPEAVKQLDLRGYDLVITSDAALMKGIRTDESATHICYCHTPMRCIWSGYENPYYGFGPITRLALSAIRGTLCRWDYEAAQRVTCFVANSQTVRGRIRKCYGRESIVIYPPVDTRRFVIGRQAAQRENFFLVVSQLVPYKRIDLIVDAFNRCKRRLVIIGDGPERRKLEQRAGRNIQFKGAVPQIQVIDAMQRCRAFVFAGEEDFGIVIAEAQVCGTPVIALGKGGATEIVKDGLTGTFFNDECVESLLDALDRFEKASYDAEVIRASAIKFNRGRFLNEFSNLVRDIQAQSQAKSRALF